jgi:hypothetical protein
MAALSNIQEIRKNQRKWGKKGVGDNSPVKRQVAKIPVRGDPAEILEDDGDDPEAQVELNTWSSQSAFEKACTEEPWEKEGEVPDSHHQELLNKEEELGFGGTFDLGGGKDTADGFKSAMFMSVVAKSAISRATSSSNIWRDRRFTTEKLEKVGRKRGESDGKVTERGAKTQGKVSAHLSLVLLRVAVRLLVPVVVGDGAEGQLLAEQRRPLAGVHVCGARARRG